MIFKVNICKKTWNIIFMGWYDVNAIGHYIMLFCALRLTLQALRCMWLQCVSRSVGLLKTRLCIMGIYPSLKPVWDRLLPLLSFWLPFSVGIFLFSLFLITRHNNYTALSISKVLYVVLSWCNTIFYTF